MVKFVDLAGTGDVLSAQQVCQNVVDKINELLTADCNGVSACDTIDFDCSAVQLEETPVAAKRALVPNAYVGNLTYTGSSSSLVASFALIAVSLVALLF